MTFPVLLASTAVLGIASYLAGMLPLSLTMSATRLAQLSTMGTGLLLGAAMGVIIPEGVEAIYDSLEASKGSEPHLHSHSSDPSFLIAASLLTGFTVMFAIEQLVTPALAGSRPQKYALGHTRPGGGGAESPGGALTPAGEDMDFDFELAEELDSLKIGKEGVPGKDPRMLTLGLVIHSFADGMALGAANALDQGSQEVKAAGGESTGLSLVVFLAIAVHKAPTALALTTTLLTQLPVRQIRQHLLAFSVASPLSALCTYMFLAFVGGATHLQNWTGIALMFSGGTFLYVATVLSSLPAHSHGEPAPSGHTSTSEIGTKQRTGLIIVGMVVPLVLSSLLGHGH